MAETSGALSLGAIRIFSLLSILGVASACVLDRSCPSEEVNVSIAHLRVTNCTADLIELTYELDATGDYEFNQITILYSCHELFNGTKLVEGQPLICQSSGYSDTRAINSSWMTNQYGTISCQFYGCILLENSRNFAQIYVNEMPVTCTTGELLKDDETEKLQLCDDFCQRMGAAGCQTDPGGVSPSGYDCVCSSGYTWNATHCKNIDECKTAETNNCTEPDSWCVDLEGTFTCVQCTNGEEWNGTSCVMVTTTSGKRSIAPPDDGSSALSMSVLGGVLALGVTTLAVLASITALYLCCKRLGRKPRVCIVKTTYFRYPYHMSYEEQEIDMNFEPPVSIYPHAVPILPSFSIGSHLDVLWEKSCPLVAAQLQETSRQYPLGDETTSCEDQSTDEVVSGSDDREQETDDVTCVSHKANVVERFSTDFTDIDSVGYVDFALSDPRTFKHTKEKNNRYE